VDFRVVRPVVHAEHDCRVDLLARRRDQHLAGARLEVHRRVVPRAEPPGRLHHQVHPEVGPRQERGIALAEHLDVVAADGEATGVDVHGRAQLAERRVVLQQVRQRGRVEQVVDRDEADRAAEQVPLDEAPDQVAADAAEAVDGDAVRHDTPPKGSAPAPLTVVRGGAGHTGRSSRRLGPEASRAPPPAAGRSGKTGHGAEARR
jgi:hypothetical protein